MKHLVGSLILVVSFFGLTAFADSSEICYPHENNLEKLGALSGDICEKTQRSKECVDLYGQMDSVDVLHKSLDCSARDSQTRSYETSKDFIQGCLMGGVEFVRKIGTAIGEGIAQSQIAAEEEAAFNKKCNADLSIKRSIFEDYNVSLPEILRVRPLPDSQLEGMHCGIIKMRLQEARDQKNFEVMKQVQRKRGQNLTPSEQEFVAYRDNARNGIPDIVEKAKAHLQKMKIQYQCYNTKAASEMLCEAIAEVGSVLGGAPLAALKFAKVTKITQLAGLNKMAKLSNSERIMEAEEALAVLRGGQVRTLTDAQRKAIIDAHEVGAGTGRGFSTYTATDLRQKAKILEKAGFDSMERDILMRKGITGSFGDEVFATRSRANVARLDAEKAARDGKIEASVDSYKKSAREMDLIMKESRVQKSERDYFVAAKLNAGAKEYDKAAEYYVKTQPSSLRSDQRAQAVFEALNREKDELRARAAKVRSAGAQKDYEDHRKLIEAVTKRADFPLSDNVKRELLKP